jgi:ATP-binding cassette, subfamily G (WHITE), member 2, PDR
LTSRVCNIVGATPGSAVVSGTRHLSIAFDYDVSHKWRNFGILLAFLVFLLACNLITSEIVTSTKSKGEVLVFPRGRLPSQLKNQHREDIEGNTASTVARKTVQNVQQGPSNVAKQTSIFHWRNVCYDVQIKNETRRILDHVDGWVKPGTLTALMVSGIRNG